MTLLEKRARFDIITSRDAMMAYHLHEWVWGEWLKNDFGTWRAQRARLRADKQAKELSDTSGGALDTAPVLREFLQSAQNSRQEQPCFLDRNRPSGHGLR